MCRASESVARHRRVATARRASMKDASRRDARRIVDRLSSTDARARRSTPLATRRRVRARLYTRDRRSSRRVDAFTDARARTNRDARAPFPSGATTPRCPTDRDVVPVPYCASSNAVYAEFEWARTCAFLHSSIHGVFVYEYMSPSRDVRETMRRTVRGQRAVGRGDDDGRRRRSETRRDVDAGERERAGGRGNGENTVVGACEIDRGGRGWRDRRGGRVWVMWMDFKCDATNE